MYATTLIYLLVLVSGAATTGLACAIAIGTSCVAFRLNARNRRQRDRISALEQERGRLTSQARHRVNDNLQTIISMLRLQRRSLIDEDAGLVLHNSHSRVAAIGLLHQVLDASDVDGKVPMADYVKRLGVEVLDRECGEDCGVSLSYDIDPVFLQPSVATPIALIFNELLTNTLRALPGADDGVAITIILKKQRCRVSLGVHPGGGNTAATVGPNEERFGRQLIELLVRKLKGNQTHIPELGEAIFSIPC